MTELLLWMAGVVLGWFAGWMAGYRHGAKDGSPLICHGEYREACRESLLRELDERCRGNR